jgi:tRNA(Ile)-lysidine synthase
VARYPTDALDGAFAAGLLAPGGRFLLAVSGGPDSMAMLAAFGERASRWAASYGVGHVDHAWRPASARLAAFVERECERRGVPCLVRRARGLHRGESREAQARALRYAALAAMASDIGAGAVVTAHTRDDAAETVILALLRGRPLSGLAGIRPARRDGVLRPFLGVPREEMLRYARIRGIPYRLDPSNADLAIERNWVRHKVLALLRKRHGESAIANLAASAESLRHDLEWLEERFASEIAPRLELETPAPRAPLDFLRTLSPAPCRRAIMALAAAAAPRFAPTRKELLALARRIEEAEPWRFQAGRRVEFRARRGWLECRRIVADSL